MLKKLLFSVLFIFTISIMAGDYNSPVQIPSINVTFDTKISDNTHNLYPCIHPPEWSDYNKKNNNYYAHLTAADFHRIFADTVSEHDVLSNYELYAYPAFREYAKSLFGYNGFITELAAKIKADKHFREKTAYIPGFASSFGFRSHKSGFHEFVASECKRIEKLETGLQIGGYVLNDCINEWSTRNKGLGGNERLEARLAAIDQIFKGNHYALHEQLRSEVSEINSRVDQLEKNYAHDRYVKILTPLVRACAAQAIKETCPLFAFQFTDFSYVVTDVLFQGMGVLYDASCCVAKGVSKGVSATLSIDHWKNIITDTVHLAGMCIKTIGQEAQFDTSYAIARSSQDSDAIMKFAEQYCLQTQREREIFKASMQESYNKLAAMSWQEVIENGSEIGTTIILDTLVLNLAGSINKTFINKLSNLTESGVIFTEQHAAEVAGFGKLIIEEGAGISSKIADICKDHSDLIFKEECVFQSMQKMLKCEPSTSGRVVAKTFSNWKAINFGVGKLEKHFNKHVLKKAEWGKLPMTMDEYLNRAKNLLNSEVSGCIDGFVSKEGWVFRYNKETNEFATATSDGIIETLFRPENGIVYWLDQIKKYG